MVRAGWRPAGVLRACAAPPGRVRTRGAPHGTRDAYARYARGPGTRTTHAQQWPAGASCPAPQARVVRRRPVRVPRMCSGGGPGAYPKPAWSKGMVKGPPWQCPSSAPAPQRGAPGGSSGLGTPPRAECGPLGAQLLPREPEPAGGTCQHGESPALSRPRMRTRTWRVQGRGGR